MDQNARVRTAAGAVLALTLSVGPASGQVPQAPAPPLPAAVLHTEAVHVAAPPKLTDYLDGGSHPGQRVSGFTQRQPKDREPATEETTVYLSYDESTFYAAFVCRASDPAMIRARLAKREDVFNDDFVAIFFDTFHDKQRAYEFFTTPRGIQADGIVTLNDDMSFDAEWQTSAQLTPTGYVAMFAIPFKVLRFPPPTDGTQHWGVALMRHIPARDENDFWPAITNHINGFATQFGVLDGLDGAAPGRNVQVIPYGTFTGARFLDDEASGYSHNAEGRAGVDTKFVVHDALTFDLTLNPDFSQVESDDPQVTVNQRFEVFFPEKRPFFLENSDIFNDTQQTLFFSRRVGDPQFGARMTGKIGQWALGGIAIDDRRPGDVADPGTAGSGERAFAAVGRARYDFKNESRIGFFATARTFGPSSNNVGAFDTRLRLGPLWSIDAQTAVDTSTDLSGVSTHGVSTLATLSRAGREFSATFQYADTSPNFHTDLGFSPREDYRQATSFMQFRKFPKHGRVIDFGPNSFVQVTTDWAGRLTDWIVRFPFQVDLRGNTFLFGRHAFITETISGVRLSEHEDLAQVGTDYFKVAGATFTYNHGTRPDYFPAAGLSPFLGTFDDVSAEVHVRPTSALLISETYLYSRLNARADSPGTGTIFSNPIHRLRVNYQFSREWSLRAIVDASRVSPNAALVDLDRSRHAGVDLLLTWLLHPGTALYLGYTDGFDNVRLDPELGVLPTASALHSTGRQVFIKASRLVRF